MRHLYILRKRFLERKIKPNQKIVVWNKNFEIYPEFIGSVFYVYNGFKFLPMQIKDNMVGQKIGVYVFTKKPAYYKLAKKKKNVMKKKKKK